MLNLSDKELDRLSREAANHHDPGDQLGPQSWDRLEFRLDKELGRLSPSPLRGIRGIRRIPFYYAPAILLLIGASWYFIKHGKGDTAKTEPSGGPPMTVVKPLSPAPNEPNTSTKTLENSQKSTSKPDKALSAEYPAPATPAASSTPNAGATPPVSGTSVPANATPPEPGSATVHRPSVGHPTHLLPESGSLNQGPVSPATNTTAKNSTNPVTSPGKNRTGPATNASSGADHPTVSSEGATAPENTGSPNGALTSSHEANGISHGSTTPNHRTGSITHGSAMSSRGANGSSHQPTNRNHNTAPLNQSSGTVAAREAGLSPVRTPRSLTRSAGIDDAALRAFALAGKPAATPIRLGKKKDASLHIERPLTFGFSLSPDFASVHSVAGDKPGRSIGLTMDYQVLNGFYISTGLLFTRKNYTANPDNFHAPRDSYRTFSANKIDLIKGSFDMLEIPLNLRYDFRANSNTVFFVSAGASSYLMTSEHSQYYFDYFGRPACLNFDKRLEPKDKNYLFSSANLSMGVETGLSNSLSLLVAPYIKIPTHGMGLGQVQITSVGLNFALRYSPVLSRKRK